MKIICLIIIVYCIDIFILVNDGLPNINLIYQEKGQKARYLIENRPCLVFVRNPYISGGEFLLSIVNESR
jgi:hypothetical protein